MGPRPLAPNVALYAQGVEPHYGRLFLPADRDVAATLRGTPYRLNLHIGLANRRGVPVRHRLMMLLSSGMTSRRNNLIILGLVVVLIGVAAYFIFIRQPVAQATQFGLDLQGGVSASLHGYRTDGSEVTRDDMEVAAGVIRQRVDSLGVTEPEIQLQGQDQVVVNLPGITDTEQAVEVIGRTAQLGFYEVLATAGGETVPEDEVAQTKEDLQSELEGDPAFEEGGTKILFEETPAPDGSGTMVQGYVVPEEPGLTGSALDSATLTRD